MVDKRHELYDQLIETWEMVRDCFDGSRGVKGKRSERYLPRLNKQPEIEYADYKKRAVFFNAVKRTVQAMIGFVFRQDPEIKTPNTPAMADFLNDCTLTGKSFYDYGKERVGDVFKIGGGGTLIDWQVEPANRAFTIAYKREDIWNWKYEEVDGRNILTLLVLHEQSSRWIRTATDEKEPDEFDTCSYEQLRVYSIAYSDDGQPYVFVRVYRHKYGAALDKNPNVPANAAQIPAQWDVVDQQIPMRGTTPLARIPFVPHGAEVNELDPGEVPMEPIADLNLAHYRNSADHENALHIAGAPTPIFVGFDFTDKGPNEGVMLGTRRGIVSDNPAAKAEILSYNASNASALVAAMDDKKQMMAAQGARILERQTSGRGIEAFETVQLRQGADTSALMTMTIACSQSLSDVLQWVVWWNDRTVAEPEDLDETVICELNTEFIQLVMEPTALHELTAAYLQGAISFETYFEKLQKGSIISSERSIEEERKALKDSPVNQPVPPAVGPDGKPLPVPPNPNLPAPAKKPAPPLKQQQTKPAATGA